MERASEEVVDHPAAEEIAAVAVPRRVTGLIPLVQEPVVGEQTEAAVDDQAERDVEVAQDVGAVHRQVALAVHRRAEEVEVHAAERQAPGRQGLRLRAASEGHEGEDEGEGDAAPDGTVGGHGIS